MVKSRATAALEKAVQLRLKEISNQSFDLVAASAAVTLQKNVSDPESISQWVYIVHQKWKKDGLI